MEELSLHILEKAENSLRAGASLIEIVVEEDRSFNRLTIEVTDDGKGISPSAVARFSRPEAAGGDTDELGLGLSLFVRSCREADGRVIIENRPEGGTFLRGDMRLDHPDRKPLGDLTEAVISLIMGAPEVEWVYRYERIGVDGSLVRREVDTRPIRRRIGELTLAHPEVIRDIRRTLRGENGDA